MESYSQTLHQCLKFCRGGLKTIHGDTKSFTEGESYFADIKFYMDEDMVPEALPAKIQSTSKGRPGKEKQQAVSHMKKRSDKQSECSTFEESEAFSKGSNTPVLQYIQVSRRKNWESPFEEETNKEHSRKL